MSIPLRSRTGRLLGVFSIHFRARRQLDDRILVLFEVLGRQLSDVIDRTTVDLALRERDIERARLLEEERAARAKAERAAKFSELFVGMLGHDLRNPLGAILAGARLVLDTSTSDRQTRAAFRIVSSTQRMTRMIDQLLDFTRIRLGKGLPVQPASTNFGELVRQIAEETEAAYGCEIKVTVAGEMLGRWDADRLGQALSNLFSNAAVHGKKGCPIVAEANVTPQQSIHLFIRNEGVVQPDILPHIFEAFRASHHQRGTARGLGLGLYITREIIVAHGGNIEVASDKESTIFKIVLPRDATTASN